VQRCRLEQVQLGIQGRDPSPKQHPTRTRHREPSAPPAMLPEHGQMTNTLTVAARHFLRSLAASSTFLPAFSRGPLPIALS
jgi:hypothetical protein